MQEIPAISRLGCDICKEPMFSLKELPGRAAQLEIRREVETLDRILARIFHEAQEHKYGQTSTQS